MPLKTPRIELLTPDLDLTATFIPGYDLLKKSDKNSPSSAQLAAIALALWELSGEQAHGAERNSWSLAQQDYYRGA